MSQANSTTRSGIYMIRCLANGKVYIGSAVDLANRERAHRSDLNGGKHHCGHLQNAWNKYRAEAFEWSIVEYIPIDGLTNEHAASLLVGREQHHMDCHDG